MITANPNHSAFGPEIPRSNVLSEKIHNFINGLAKTLATDPSNHTLEDVYFQLRERFDTQADISRGILHQMAQTETMDLGMILHERFSLQDLREISKTL